jgi:hypothetical protein
MKLRCFAFLLVLLLLIPVVSASNPVITDISPANNETNVVLDNGKAYLHAKVVDADGDLDYILFETNKSGSWSKITDVYPSGENWSENTAITFPGLSYDSTYYWRIKARDDAGNWTNTSVLKFKTGKTTGEEITIIPNQPRAGKNIVFLVNLIDGAGYVLCHVTSNVYLLSIKNGIGVVELEMEEYGEALVNIIDYGSKTFTITSPYAGDLVIDIPSVVDVGNDAEVSVLAKGVMLSTKLVVITPSGKEKELTTSSSTPLIISFDEAGNWTLTAEIYNTTATETVFAKPQPIEIDVRHENDLSVNEEVEIETNAGVTVIIEKGETSWTYEADEEGKVYFLPPWSGRYKITATSLGQSGTKYFDVKAETSLVVRDEKGNLAGKIGQGNVLLLQVISDDFLEGDNKILIYADDYLYKTIDLTGNSALWAVDTHANNYRFDFYPDEDAPYLPASLSVVGGGGAGVDALYIYIVAIVITVFIIFLLISYKKGWNLSLSKLLPKKEEEELL